jgi:prepilin-type N-terminal cleavage/methylation domain-containing protein
MESPLLVGKPAKGPKKPALGAEGFSLLEVLVASALMGLVLVVLLQVLTSAIRAQEASWGHTQALLVAEKILQENCQINTLTGGTYQGQDGRYDYVVHITPQYELGGTLADRRIICSMVQVTVAWQERGQRKTLELETLRTDAQKKS